MMRALSALIKAAVFHGYTEASQLQSLFPKDFHKNLRDLLIKIMMDNMNNWRNQAVNSQDFLTTYVCAIELASTSLPRMVDFDWRVDIKTSSDTITRMAVPTCILQMKVQDNIDKIGNTPDVQNVNVELSKETLDTMLDGLSKIRDQLSSVAKR
ncbi:hypothetical protein FSP39_019060 [Pinctada imbricata]|uniref:COMM domain-containing protein n=1 Tax=Pinctada imbricata TaxID=66713 RepID=A0AA88YEH1_PINIB|nr:hypothetical protein FSP39_019060 [Pinctada imbricata]